MYQLGGTLLHCLKQIETNRYVLPAIQREFVWSPEQICQLFDSLMQGYPFGTFLFWKVAAENSGNYRFYGFVRDYHERDRPHCPEISILPNTELTAVLDGQQRLTALNIGLRGSLAIKEPNKRWSNSAAFPEKHLYLDLLAKRDEEEQGSAYRFRFIADNRVLNLGLGEHWFRVADILKMHSGPDMSDWLVDAGLKNDEYKRAYRTMDRLHNVVHREPVVAHYEERSQELERVLNIFIRMNSGGTVLSYSDLLLSIAVAQWTKRDARKEIHALVDDLNEIGTGFQLSKDFVLKAGLMLCDIKSVGFKVENFNRENMSKLEENWHAIRRSLVQTVELISGFGLTGHNLRADSALLPIAYYLYRKAAPENYLTHSQFAVDRTAIQHWLFRSLLKTSGIWGSGLDTLLTALRTTMQEAGFESFPSDQLKETMVRRGKSLNFEAEEIEELANLHYQDRRTFVLLSLLYPFVDLRNQFHLDHIFPVAHFTRLRLTKAGVAEDRVPEFIGGCNLLANLQLLEGPFNNEKRTKLPAPWLVFAYPDEITRQNYCEKHDLGVVPEEVGGFLDFAAARREKLVARITILLGR